ncbi:hypothetical protein EV202_11728 [Bacteroides heparinolyticus]|uniref:Uncharacterized protein n=1 Tax=Prevotella heparinolytica TaxID=28113 RepID=A0A4R2LQB1_9BACE|nr:hypothetical protein EV202_11728 [Bacteroides heparinolyticus]
MNLNFAVLFLVRKMTAELMEEKNIYILDVSPLHLGSLYRCPWLEIYMQHARHIFAARWIYISIKAVIQISLAREASR